MPPALDLDPQKLRGALEACLFVAPEPLAPATAAHALGVGAPEARKIMQSLQEEYRASGRGFELVEVAGGWRMMSAAQFAPIIARLKVARAERRLSPAALETLAVISYRQPIARADVEAIRGVNCGQLLRNLMDRRLVRIAGRAEALGAPILYGTTKEFLEHFGLNSLKDLPRSGELSAG